MRGILIIIRIIRKKVSKKLKLCKLIETIIFYLLRYVPILRQSPHIQFCRKMKEADLLILDEQTKNLDIQTLTILGEYIDQFEGAVLFYSMNAIFWIVLRKRLFHLQANPSKLM